VTRGDARLDSIDGLRGLAALMVLASHASAAGMNLVPGLSMEGIGKYGVYLFFVISAYLLTAQWLAAPRDFGARAWARYFVRRVARIYPLYTVVLLLGWMLTPPGLGVPLDGRAVWEHLSLQEGRGVYWSVPVEFLYYLVIPPLAWCLAAPLAWWWRGVAVLMLLIAVMRLYPSSEAPLNSTHLAYYLPVFLCGSVAAWWVHERGNSADVPRVRRSWIGDALVLALLVLSIPAVFGALGWGSGLTTLHRQFLLWGLFWALVVVALRTDRLPALSTVLRWRGLVRCGQWCFGLYLLHLPALAVARRLPWLPSEVKAWVAVALSTIVAALAWRLVERPAITMAKRLTPPADSRSSKSP
jgi:peptidoglycan/LPS O-acetylase OafA/YrhL